MFTGIFCVLFVNREILKLKHVKFEVQCIVERGVSFNSRFSKWRPIS